MLLTIPLGPVDGRGGCKTMAPPHWRTLAEVSVSLPGYGVNRAAPDNPPAKPAGQGGIRARIQANTRRLWRLLEYESDCSTMIFRERPELPPSRGCRDPAPPGRRGGQDAPRMVCRSERLPPRLDMSLGAVQKAARRDAEARRRTSPAGSRATWSPRSCDDELKCARRATAPKTSSGSVHWSAGGCGIWTRRSARTPGVPPGWTGREPLVSKHVCDSRILHVSSTPSRPTQKSPVTCINTVGDTGIEPVPIPATRPPAQAQ